MDTTKNNTPVYIFDSTAEFVSPDLGHHLDIDEEIIDNPEIDEKVINDLDLWPYSGITEVNLSPEDFLARLLKFIGEPDRFMDDGDFYDYMPDAIEMALQFAAAHGENVFKDFYGTLRENPTLIKFYKDDYEKTLSSYIDWDHEIDLHKEYKSYLLISDRARDLYTKLNK